MGTIIKGVVGGMILIVILAILNSGGKQAPPIVPAQQEARPALTVDVKPAPKLDPPAWPALRGLTVASVLESPLCPAGQVSRATNPKGEAWDCSYTRGDCEITFNLSGQSPDYVRSVYVMVHSTKANPSDEAQRVFGELAKCYTGDHAKAVADWLDSHRNATSETVINGTQFTITATANTRELTVEAK